MRKGKYCVRDIQDNTLVIVKTMDVYGRQTNYFILTEEINISVQTEV